jgi:arylsulfatase A
MLRRHRLAALILPCAMALSLPSPLAAAQGGEPERPNIVVIMADDLGYGDLSCYGARLISTPHCDRLAREGRRFTDAHSPSAVCSPTRFGLLTGGYPWRDERVPRHLHAAEPLVIRDGETTLASMLKQQGYATACIGKWHLGAQRRNPIDWDRPLSPGPNNVGFDEFFGVINSHNQAPFVWVENDRILDRLPDEHIAIEGQQTQTAGRRTRDEHDGERLLGGACRTVHRAKSGSAVLLVLSHLRRAYAHYARQKMARHK